MNAEKMQKLKNSQDVDRALDGGRAVILKHSTQCPISRFVHREVSAFMAERPEVPVYFVDVLADPEVSTYLGKKTGVRHESPQAFVVEKGSLAWHGSHYGVDAEALGKQFDGASAR